jgi:hypothetical protein
MKRKMLQLMFVMLLCASVNAQVNSGSNGSDGPLNPMTNIVINMADHPDGIYQYTSVNISNGVTVSFIPNANNTPVVWLVQTDCVINGNIQLTGQDPQGQTGGIGGPGGFGGGNGTRDANYSPSSGLGPGGGSAPTSQISLGGNASFATTGGYFTNLQSPPGAIYGNDYLVPLIGGSGGSGSPPQAYNGYYDRLTAGGGGGGGGGAILIAASSTINMNGSISVYGGGCNANAQGGGGGSGGAVRLVASTLKGGGSINCSGGLCGAGLSGNYPIRNTAGYGRVRFDRLVDNFTGSIQGVQTRGFQPIILPAPAQQVELAIASIAGIAVPANTSGSLLNPAVIIPGQQVNPIPVVVHCSNIPLNTTITVQVNPAIGATVTAAGLNNVGTEASSTAIIPVNMPRGGGVIYASAVTPITFASNDNGEKYGSYAKTGWTADGERFAKMELTVTPGGRQRVVYLTASGKRYPL